MKARFRKLKRNDAEFYLAYNEGSYSWHRPEFAIGDSPEQAIGRLVINHKISIDSVIDDDAEIAEEEAERLKEAQEKTAKLMAKARPMDTNIKTAEPELASGFM